MNLLKKLAGLFTAPAWSGANMVWLTVQCNRCGEVIQTQVNVHNDLSVEYDEGGNVTGYFCRKILMGKQRCFQPIEVALTFDAHHKLIEHKIDGGKFVEG